MTTQTVGIISKYEHIKTYAENLRAEGYDAVCLGCGPTKISANIDILVLRTQGCSRLGSDTAYAWSRATRKPLIVENGLSGIVMKLRELASEAKAQAQPQNSELASALQEALRSSKKDSPKVEQVARALHPRHARICEESKTLWANIPASIRKGLRTHFAEASKGAKGVLFFPPEVRDPSVEILSGRPNHFFLIMYWALEGLFPATRDLQRAYMEFCGKGSVKSCVEDMRDLASSASPAVEPEPQLTPEPQSTPEPVEVTPEPVEVTPEPQVTHEPFFVGVERVIEVFPSTKPEVKEVSSDSDLKKSFRALEDFALENFEATGQSLRKLLDGVAALQEEVRLMRGEMATATHHILSFREENKQLRQSLEELTQAQAPKVQQTQQDAFAVLESLRDRGASITISLGNPS